MVLHDSETIWSDSQQLSRLAARACERLVEHGLRPIQVPADYWLLTEWAGSSLSIEPSAFVGEDIAFARVVRVDGGESVQVLNVVIFPTEASARPILGCEILVFRHGVHLFVLDAFETLPGTHLQVRRTLARLRPSLEELAPLEATPEWGAHVFSPDVLIQKPGARRELSVDCYAESFCTCLDEVLSSPDPCPVTSSEREEIVSRRHRYLHDHGHEEPAGPFLTRIAGAQWVESFVFEFLYPTWLYRGDRTPPYSHASSLRMLA